MNALTKAAWEFKRQYIREVVIQERKLAKRGVMQRAAVRLGVHRNTVCRAVTLKELTDERDPQPTAQEVRALQRGAESGITPMSRLRKPNESVSDAPASPQEIRLQMWPRTRKVRFSL